MCRYDGVCRVDDSGAVITSCHYDDEISALTCDIPEFSVGAA